MVEFTHFVIREFRINCGTKRCNGCQFLSYDYGLYFFFCDVFEESLDVSADNFEDGGSEIFRCKPCLDSEGTTK